MRHPGNWPLLVVAFLLAAAIADRAGHRPGLVLADSTVTILRSKSQETVKVEGDSTPDNSKGKAGARDASEFCPPPYRMTERDGCQAPTHR